MALLYEGMTCPLCHQELDIHSRLFATSGVFFSPDHRLFAYCDAAMHWDCYANWPDRVEFAGCYFQMWVEPDPDNPYWRQAFLSQEVLGTVNPDPSVAKVSLLLAKTGSFLQVSLDRWNDLIQGPVASFTDLHPVERDALSEVWPLLQEALPSASALGARVDQAARQEALQRHKEKTRRSEEERLRKTKAHNKACRALVREGIECPYCKAEDIRYLDKSPEAKSYFICGSCGRSFGPIDVAIPFADLPAEPE
jgi:uncharacterized protein YbaR (Trm112 family)